MSWQYITESWGDTDGRRKITADNPIALAVINTTDGRTDGTRPFPGGRSPQSPGKDDKKSALSVRENLSLLARRDINVIRGCQGIRHNNAK